MTPKKLLILTAIVAALFGFIVLIERKMPSTAERERKGDLYWDIPDDRLERITVVRGAETLEFQKSATAPWRMVKPDPYPADTFAVNSLATELAELKRAGGDSGDARPADYGLDKPAVKATFVWSEAGDPKVKKSRTIEFGMEIPGTDVAAARLEGTSSVLFVPTATLAALKKNTDDFRSREILGGATGDISRVDILRGRGRLVLAKKDGAWWLSEPLTDLADAAETDRLVGQLTGLRVRDFIHGGEDLATLGLNPPLFHVAVTGAKGAVTSVDFGSTRTDGNSVYARQEGQVFTVDGEIVGELSKEAVAFRSTALVALNRSDVAGVEGAFPKTRVTLSQKDGGWTAEGRPVLAGTVDDLLTAVADLKSQAFLDEAQARELPPAVATVTIRPKTGAAWTITLHTRPEGVAAKVSTRVGAFALDLDAPEKLEAAFRKAVPPPATAVPPTPVAKKK